MLGSVFHANAVVSERRWMQARARVCVHIKMAHGDAWREKLKILSVEE